MKLALNLHRIRSFGPSKALVRTFRVLAFETSADDTGVAIVDDTKVLSNVILKQHADHEEFRGIHPQVALQMHDKNLPTALRQALKEASFNVQDIDGIAFTRGPGMPGCLAVGANAARTLAAALDKPLVGVHHMQAHALTALYTSQPPPSYPFLTLLVSGGHTLLLLAHSRTSFEIMATTRDDSIGNAFDRVATLLNVPWSRERSAGASLEAFALGAPELSAPFPIPMSGKLAFSYSGLISSVRAYILTRSDPEMTIDPPQTFADPFLKHPPTPERAAMQERIRRTVEIMSLQERKSIAAAFQRAAVGQLEAKLRLGLKECLRKNVHPGSIVVSGGVASNSYLRARLRCVVESDTEAGIRLVFPPPALCTDNAVMIAWASLERFQGQDYDELSANIRPTWSIEDICVRDG
ncbi:glycoprotease/Kae1 family metallohydrolase [Ceratobasidium sp. AG-Ba]|nr:glycoprotease/Kae1 family metallohydrolase [Ceratobasidium sp. AG-Ba]